MSGCPELRKLGIAEDDLEAARDICCTCQKKRCWYDLSKAEKFKLGKKVRNAAIKKMAKAGKKETEIAKHFGISQRTVKRILKP